MSVYVIIIATTRIMYGVSSKKMMELSSAYLCFPVGIPLAVVYNTIAADLTKIHNYLCEDGKREYVSCFTLISCSRQWSFKTEQVAFCAFLSCTDTILLN